MERVCMHVFIFMQSFPFTEYEENLWDYKKFVGLVILNWRHLTGKHLEMYESTLVSQWWRGCQAVTTGLRSQELGMWNILQSAGLSCTTMNYPTQLPKVLWPLRNTRNLVITSKWSLKFIAKKYGGRGMYRLYVDPGATHLEFIFNFWLWLWPC